MIRRLEASNFRMLRGSSVELQPFQVLVGQNATGKSTFLDALDFISDILERGLRDAVKQRTPNFYDLCFWPEQPLALAVEVSLPGEKEQRQLRYEIEVDIEEAEGLRIRRENLFLLPGPQASTGSPQDLFGGIEPIHESLPTGWQRSVSKSSEGRVYFYDERTDWKNAFRFSPDKAALGSLPEDVERFPLSLTVLETLRDGVRTLALDAREMRSPSPPGQDTRLALDGSNLPHVVRAFRERDPVLFRQWVEHVSIAIEGLEDVDVWERPEDRHLILRARFAGEHADPVPSWFLSDGTLRLMALTLVSFASTEDEQSTYLIEEPENGLHPLAIQSAFEALAQPTLDVQVLCATHSPIFLAQPTLEQTLVFRRAEDGSAIVRRGPEVAELAEWSGSVNLVDLFVTGNEIVPATAQSIAP